MSPKIWLITGTSTGLGRQLTEIVLENGDIAVATARRPEALSDLSSKYPSDRLLVLKLDTGVPEDILAAFSAIKEKFGRLDVVVNNAGIAVYGEIELVNEQGVRSMFETNFWGAANVTREAVKFMRDVNPSGAGGRILQISSITGVQGYPAMGYYSATKQFVFLALEGFSESFAAELDPTWNIKISIVSTGAFDTKGLGKHYWPPAHPAYEKLTAPTAMMRKNWDEFLVAGRDPRKGMEAVYKLASLEDPPMHFPLGKDAVEAFNKKATRVLAEAKEYASWSDNLEKTVQ
ncbi:NAD(P)-binding protein [Daedaleopsis nitida]|nr:NAD(P)-binding protein [Daedaleopsis nitida]